MNDWKTHEQWSKVLGTLLVLILMTHLSTHISIINANKWFAINLSLLMPHVIGQKAEALHPQVCLSLKRGCGSDHWSWLMHSLPVPCRPGWPADIVSGRHNSWSRPWQFLRKITPADPRHTVTWLEICASAP